MALRRAHHQRLPDDIQWKRKMLKEGIPTI